MYSSIVVSSVVWYQVQSHRVTEFTGTPSDWLIEGRVGGPFKSMNISGFEITSFRYTSIHVLRWLPIVYGLSLFVNPAVTPWVFFFLFVFFCSHVYAHLCLCSLISDTWRRAVSRIWRLPQTPLSLFRVYLLNLMASSPPRWIIRSQASPLCSPFVPRIPPSPVL